MSSPGSPRAGGARTALELVDDVYAAIEVWPGDCGSHPRWDKKLKRLVTPTAFVGKCDGETRGRVADIIVAWAAPRQPDPSEGEGDVWSEVISARVAQRGAGDPVVALMAARREVGLRRYGRLLQRDNGRDHQVDALEEALDLVAYLQAANSPHLSAALALLEALAHDHERANPARLT